MKPLALYRLARRPDAAYRLVRLRFHRRAVLAQRRRIRSLLAIRVEDKPEADERSSIEQFKRRIN